MPMWVAEEEDTWETVICTLLVQAACWNCTSCAMLKFVGVVGGLVRHQARALGVCHTKLRTCSARLGLKYVQKKL